MSEATRQKILAVIEETGYVPNAFARGLGLNTMNTVGILCADSSDLYLAEAIYCLEQGLHSNNYDSLLCCTGYEHEPRRNYMKLLLSKHVDAIFLVGSNYVETTSEKNQYILDAAKNVPVVIVNGYLEGENIYCSVCDDWDALHKATNRAIRSGREHPFYLYRSLTYSGIRKLEGYETACREAGFSSELIRSHCIDAGIYEVRDCLCALYEEAPFDMVLTSDDELAVGALKFARKKGLRVPGDLSILGYNNSRLALCCDPELSSIDNQLSFTCTSAITLLMKTLHGEPVPSRTMLSAKVAARGTTDQKFRQLT